MLSGFPRVATDDQRLDPQDDALKQRGYERVFNDALCRYEREAANHSKGA